MILWLSFWLQSTNTFPVRNCFSIFETTNRGLFFSTTCATARAKVFVCRNVTEVFTGTTRCKLLRREILIKDPSVRESNSAFNVSATSAHWGGPAPSPGSKS